jgi:dTDP-4-amino-4,6-dideoxygalactose transaminase
MNIISHFCLKRQYHILKEELAIATNEALRDGLFVQGRFLTQFEDWLAKKTNAKYALACHSGTQALEIIARYHHKKFYDAFKMKPAIKIPNLTYVATLNAFITADYDIKILDTDENGLMIEEEPSLEDAHTGVCIIGLYGARPKKYNNGQPIRIHDGAQHWLVTDEIDEGMAISFDPTKNLPSSGNGGALVTNDYNLWEYAYSYRDNGAIKGVFGGNYIAGTNSKMSEIEAAHLLVRSKYIDQWQARRQSIARYWCEQFKNVNDLRCLSDGVTPHQYQKFVVYTSKRKELEAYLKDNRIETRVNYRQGLSELPIAQPYSKPDMLSTSIMLSRGVISLPIYSELLDTEVEYIADTVRKFFTY